MIKNKLYLLATLLWLTIHTLSAETITKNFLTKQGDLYKREYWSYSPIDNKQSLAREDIFNNGMVYTKTFSTQGKVQEEGYFITENIRQGEWKFYAANNLQKIVVYEYGFETSPSREIYPSYNGTEVVTSVIDHFPEGGIKERKYYTRSTAQPTGNWEYYISKNNTQYLEHTEKYVNGELCKRIQYNIPEGFKQIEQYFKEGKPTGEINYYAKDGSLVETTQHINNTITQYKNGRPYYTITPSPTNNKLTYFSEYYEDGVTKAAGALLAGEKEGLWQEYATVSNNHVLLREILYNKNQPRLEKLTPLDEPLSIITFDEKKQRHGLWVEYVASDNLFSLILYNHGAVAIMPDQFLVTTNISANYVNFSIHTSKNNTLLQGALCNGLPIKTWNYYCYALPKELEKQIFFSSETHIEKIINHTIEPSTKGLKPPSKKALNALPVKSKPKKLTP